LHSLQKQNGGNGESHGNIIFPYGKQQGGLKLKAEITFHERQDFYLLKLKRFDDVAVLKFGKNFLFESIDRAIDNPLLDVLDHIAENDNIKE